MAERIEWTQVATYGARWEADLPAQRLEEAGIPVMIKGEESGIWGPAFAGPTSQGLSLEVPANRAEEARKLLAEDAEGSAGAGDSGDE